MRSTSNRPNKLLVSACLMGEPVRYDGRGKTLDNQDLEELLRQQRVIAFCPEVAGGLGIPRDAAEIQAGDGNTVLDNSVRVKTIKGDDVTDYFLQGAYQALDLCRKHAIEVAVLTDFSPSCGSSQVYDGSFQRQPIPGVGVTTALLKQQGISVFNQQQIGEAIKLLKKLSHAI